MGRIYAKFGKYGLQNAYFCPVFLESSQNLRKIFGIIAKFAYLCDVKIKQIANNNQ